MIKKISLVGLGILLIVLFELSLCFIGKIFLYARSLNSPLDNKKFTKQIYCIGDSHTFGVGASSKYSYPKQLQALLNLNNPQTTYNVVNLGIPGDSTKHQIERLAAFLSKNRADLVILLTGRNNYYEVKTWKNESFLTDIIVKIQKMRTYKIVQYVLNRFFKLRIKEGINAPMERTKYENYMEYQLLRAKSLCEKYGCELLLISYFSGSDKYIEKFAKQLGILHLDLSRDFYKTIRQENIDNFFAGTHLNHYGYKIFTELLYKQIFLHRADLNLKLNPLSKRIDKDNFYQNPVTHYLRYVQGKHIFY